MQTAMTPRKSWRISIALYRSRNKRHFHWSRRWGGDPAFEKGTGFQAGIFGRCLEIIGYRSKGY